MRRFVIAAIALTVFAACQPTTTELTEGQKAAIEAEIRQLDTDMGHAWNAHDYDEWRSHFADDVRFNGESGFMQGEQIFEAVRPYLESDAEFSSELVDDFVRVLGPNAAVKGSVIHNTTVLPSGESSTSREIMTTVWYRVDGEWKIVHGQSTEASM
jgi:uncharacterized protein (TIGR02246 family)